jgi:hypothetical protein
VTSNLDENLIGRLRQARSANSEELFQLILDPHPDVLQTALKNRRLNEEHLLALLKRRDLPEELLKKVYQRHTESASHKLLLALVKNPNTPGGLVRNLLPRLHLFELLNLCILPGATPDQRLAAEQAIMRRLPMTPLGTKITLARRATAAVVAELLKEGDPQLLSTCLSSPRLQEAAIYQFLHGPKATAETISLIARHSRWQQRPNLRLAILKNRHTPNVWFTLWLPNLRSPLLKQLLAGQRLNPAQKALVQAELKKR